MTQPSTGGMAPDVVSPSCIVCGSHDAASLIDLGVTVPVLCNVLHDTRSEALAAPSGWVSLFACHACGHVWNTAFDETLVDYGQRYENSLHFSPTFQGFVQELVAELVDDFGVRDGTVVEVGCGKGDFLAMLCRVGGNSGIGFDPSYAGHQDPDAGRGLFVVAEPFPEVAQRLFADLVVTRHVLEHVADPLSFLRALTESVSQDGHPLQYHEVPNGQYLLERVALWDVIYEHPSHFTPRSLRLLLGSAGLEVDRMSASFGDQYLSAVCRGGRSVRAEPSSNGTDDALVSRFAARSHDLMDSIDSSLGTALDAGSQVALWGVGSKGVTFLNVVERASEIHHVIDVNPRKHGRFVPLTGHRVDAPEALVGADVDLVLVMNLLYVEEVRATLRAAGVSCEVEAVPTQTG